MKYLLSILALSAIPAMALADQAGRPAYPNNWTGGPPLPPLDPANAPDQSAYSYYPLAPPPYGTSGHMQVYTTTTISADCIRSNLNGTHWQDGCRKLNLSYAEAAKLRREYLQN